jgi:hypothetical protein
MTTTPQYGSAEEAIEAALAQLDLARGRSGRDAVTVRDSVNFIRAQLARVAPPKPVAVDKVRAIAADLGWGIGVHGSLRRDYDLIAVPWTKDAAPRSSLKQAICDALGYRELGRDTQRPHGRCTALLVANDATHEQELFNRGEFIGPPDPKGQWIPPAIDLSFVDPRELEAIPKPAPVGMTITEEMVQRALNANYRDMDWDYGAIVSALQACQPHVVRGWMRAALAAALGQGTGGGVGEK